VIVAKRQGGYRPKRARWFLEWPTSRTKRKNREEKGKRREVGKKWKRVGWRKERKRKWDRKGKGRERGNDSRPRGGGRFALKFKYHSRGRALTLRSVEHSGPIWIHYNVFASSPGPVIPSIRIMPPHFNTAREGQRENDASKLFGNEDIRTTNNWLACLAWS